VPTIVEDGVIEGAGPYRRIEIGDGLFQRGPDRVSNFASEFSDAVSSIGGNSVGMKLWRELASKMM